MDRTAGANPGKGQNANRCPYGGQPSARRPGTLYEGRGLRGACRTDSSGCPTLGAHGAYHRVGAIGDVTRFYLFVLQELPPCGMAKSLAAPLRG